MKIVVGFEIGEDERRIWLEVGAGASACLALFALGLAVAAAGLAWEAALAAWGY